MNSKNNEKNGDNSSNNNGNRNDNARTDGIINDGNDNDNGNIVCANANENGSVNGTKNNNNNNCNHDAIVTVDMYNTQQPLDSNNNQCMNDSNNNNSASKLSLSNGDLSHVSNISLLNTALSNHNNIGNVNNGEAVKKGIISNNHKSNCTNDNGNDSTNSSIDIGSHSATVHKFDQVTQSYQAVSSHLKKAQMILQSKNLQLFENNSNNDNKQDNDDRDRTKPDSGKWSFDYDELSFLKEMTIDSHNMTLDSQIVSGIKGNNINTKIECIEKLNKLLNLDNSAMTIDIVIQSGIVPELMPCLDHETNLNDMVFSAVDVLQIMVNGSKKQAGHVVQHGM